ncbi:MAG TPA: hypothetical protein VI588_01200, partial [Candidatus Gracilibacteria bacterium]|nr:hypothetical protein [Candidatus Gracilibacteria bacterium]
STAGAAVWLELGSSGAITGTTSNSFTLDTDNTGGNVTLQFGGTLAETLQWDNGNLRFNLSDDLSITDGLTVGGNVSVTGNTALGTTTANARLDVNGDLALRQTGVSLGNGNNSNVNVGSFSFIRITGPTAAFSVTGITGGQNGRVIILYNSTGNIMTISNQAGSSTAANRIITNTGAAVATVGTGTVILVYDSTVSRWILISSVLG